MWSYEKLYMKAKLYVRKGIEHENLDDFDVPFWCILSLELLTRATLSKVNPALLADPKEGSNILFACGFPATKSPISIPAKTVFHRCTVICPNFTKKEYDQCMIWLNYRNEEVHTGALSLHQIKNSEWMPEFYRICKILLDFNGETLKDFVGAEHLEIANKMIDSLEHNKKEEAYNIISKAKTQFNKLDAEVRLEKLKESKNLRLKDWINRSKGLDIQCPACEGAALIIGELIRTTTPRDKNGELVQEDIYLPSELKCYCCNLKLKGFDYLHAIGKGDQFTKTSFLDPRDYYGIEFDPNDYYDQYEDYGND